MRANANLILALALATAVPTVLSDAGTRAPLPPGDRVPPRERTVDVAICLDTSGSMNGLIDAARQNLWAVVNDLATATPTPRLRVALLTFGNDGHAAEGGWVQVQTPFTDDLDLVSQKLFALTTNGGTEYVGRVLQASLEQLQWTTDPDALKVVFVAGNEAADQDPTVDFRAMSRRAIERGILVNSIYCGNPADGLAPAWKEVATLADGQFAAIDQDRGTVTIATPFDEKLTALSAELNTTYLPFGAQGSVGFANQRAQDDNASKLNPAAAAQRAECKAGALYSCGWDLVDACRDAAFDLQKVRAEELPEPMRKMSAAERAAHVAKMGERRTALQKEIAEVGRCRQEFVAAEMKKQALDPTKGFDHAVRAAVRGQAQAKGFRYGQQQTPAAKGNDIGATGGAPAGGAPAGRE